MFFTAGVINLDRSIEYRAVAILSHELVAPKNVEVHLELRQLRVPVQRYTTVGFVFFILGMGGLLLTRPK